MRARKIDERTEELICNLSARGLSPYLISKELKKHDISLHHSSIDLYLNKPKNRPKVEKAVELYRSNPMAVAISHKRVRLDGMDRERLRILQEISRMCGDKDGFIGNIPKKGWSRYTTLLKRLLEIYDRAVGEIEKKPESLKRIKWWVDMGTAEDFDRGSGKGPIEHTRNLVQVFDRNRLLPGRDYYYFEDYGAEHNEAAWAGRFDKILLYLFGK